MSGCLVVTDRVQRRFGEHLAVAGADLTVDAGEVVGLIGANGAGKTTLVRLLLGLVAPTAGRVELFGRPPTRAARARVGYVPQGLGLYTDLSVAENLAFVGAVFGQRPSAAEIAASGADPAALVGTLPLGRRRRAAFAAALLHRPELLVLDEPTSGVDPLGRAHLWDTVHDAADAGAGVLVTTHAMSEAEQCDRLVVMAAGRVVATGPPADLVASRRSVRVRAGDWAAAFDALDVAGVDVALAGTELRVSGGDPRRVRDVLDGAGVAARVDDVRASLEETFAVLAQEA